MKRRTALCMALAMLLITLLTSGALASYEGSYQTMGGTDTTVTIKYTMSKNNPHAPNPITVTFNQRTTQGRTIDSFKIQGSVALKDTTKSKTKTGTGSFLLMMIDVNYGSTIVSATGKFYTYSKEYGNGMIQAACQGSQL